MNHFKYFVATVIAVLVVCGAVVYALGPKLIYLGFLEPKRDQPLVVLHGATATDPSESAASAGLAQFNAVELGHYALSYMPEGRERQRLNQLRITQYDAAADLLRVITDGDNPHPPAASDTLLASFDLLSTPLPRVIVLFATIRGENQPLSPMAMLDGHSQLGDLVYWRGTLTTIKGVPGRKW